MYQNYLDPPQITIYDSSGHCNTEALRDTLRIEDYHGKPRYYDIEKGYYTVDLPGWIIYDLGTEREISYLRLLLWDNCGSEKKQPTRRRYFYRLLLGVAREDNTYHWDVVYDNMNNGSNGWQEFYFLSRPKKIRYIKLHCVQASARNRLHLVNIQAYGQPTRELYEHYNRVEPGWLRKFFGKKSPFPPNHFAPPIRGMVKNKVIFCDPAEDAQTVLSFNIYEELNRKLEDLRSFIGKQIDDPGENVDSLKQGITRLIHELEDRKKELVHFNTDISKFQDTIYSPIRRQMKKSRIPWVLSIISFALSLIVLVIDTCYTKGWIEPRMTSQGERQEIVGHQTLPASETGIPISIEHYGSSPAGWSYSGPEFYPGGLKTDFDPKAENLGRAGD